MPWRGDRQPPRECKVQSEKCKAEQQHVDLAESYSKRGQEPDDRCDQGKHAMLVPTRSATRNEG